MTNKYGLSNNKMAGRIYNREDNQYKRSMIKEILDMYADEVYKAMMEGYRFPKLAQLYRRSKHILGDIICPSATNLREETHHLIRKYGCLGIGRLKRQWTGS